MPQTKLSSKHQLVIPKEVRRKMKLTSGMIVTIYPLDSQRALLLKHPKSHAEALEGLGQEVWQELGGTEKYLREERSSWKQ